MNENDPTERKPHGNDALWNESLVYFEEIEKKICIKKVLYLIIKNTG